MSDHREEIIIVKRKGGHHDGHHGGAWKIAFADFMTAMMAFFMVLWIINATDKNTKSVIARYFNPVRLEDPARGAKGVRGESQAKEGEGEAGTEEGGPMEKSENKPDKEQKGAKSKPAAEAKEHAEKSAAEPQNAKSKETAEHPDPAHPKQKLPESALASDPYGSLDRIAGPPPAETEAQARHTNAESQADPFKDPFAPKSEAEENSNVERPRPEASASPASQHEIQQNQSFVKAEEPKLPPAGPASPNVASSETAPKATGATPQKSSLAAQIQKEIRVKMGAAKVAVGPAIEVRATNEGVLISLTDDLNFSMFPLGSAEPQAQVVRAMNVIAQALSSRPGGVVIRGHTDARPYRSAMYDNWRLSEARAQMAYYMLTRAHLDEHRVEHVEGYADRSPRNNADPYAPQNRRIEVLLRDSRP